MDIISSTCHSSISPSASTGGGGNCNGGGGDHVEAALIARIYGSHLHEGRSLPYSTVTITDVHALHRTQSRFAAFAKFGMTIMRQCHFNNCFCRFFCTANWPLSNFGRAKFRKHHHARAPAGDHASNNRLRDQHLKSVFKFDRVIVLLSNGRISSRFQLLGFVRFP
jgi:hypothetical protein